METTVVFEVVEKSKSTFYKVSKEEVLIGRDEETCDIVILDDGASKRHCLLEFRQNKWWAVDLDSKNGTYMNNSPIKRSQVYLDDIIQIGEAYLRFASSQMPLTVCQKLRRPGKKYSHNKSITLVQGKKKSKDQIFEGEHHGLKEFTATDIDDAPTPSRKKSMLEKRKKKNTKKD